MYRFEVEKRTVSYLQELHKKGKLNLQPDYQRSQVWNDRLKRDLIDTTLREWPMGLVMINVIEGKDGDGRTTEFWDLVDGQQRISTLFAYKDGKDDWAKRAPTKKSDFLPYRALTTTQQERFDSYMVAVALMREYDRDDILYVYSRLQNSSSLTLGEKVKALPTEFKPMLRDLAEHKIFRIASGRHRRRDAHWNLSGQFFKSVYRSMPLDRQEFENLQAFLREEPFDEATATRAEKDTSAILNFMGKVIEEALRQDPTFSKALHAPRLVKWLFAAIYLLRGSFAVKGKEHLLAKGLVQYHEARTQEGSEEWTAYRSTGTTGRIDTDEVRDCIEQMMNRMIIAAELEPLDERRLFTKEQRQEIFKRAQGKCEYCSMELSKTNFHADHRQPHGRGGTTTLENGQALCTKCNRQKSARDTSPIFEASVR